MVLGALLKGVRERVSGSLTLIGLLHQTYFSTNLCLRKEAERVTESEELIGWTLYFHADAGNRCIKFCNDAKLLDKFRESAKLLDMVQKGLSDYLETKRAGFSRFYFLSNDELLEILSQTKVGL